MVAYKRPEYTKRVIDGLKNCKGIEKYKLLAFIEPGYEEVTKLFSDIDFVDKNIYINECVLGINGNTFQAISHGFKYSDYVIHLEDDTVPAPDTLEYFEWAGKEYKENGHIFTVCGYNKVDEVKKKDYHTVFQKSWFTPWGWAIWEDRWELVDNAWDSNEKLSWDVFVNQDLRDDSQKYADLFGFQCNAW